MHPDRDPHAFRAERDDLVAVLRGKGVGDEAVLAAMAAVPRHRFVPAPLADLAYEDRPLPFDEEQMVSQPWVVARLTELARLTPTSRVLDVGTGSGYQAAVMAEIARSVHSVEIRPALATSAHQRLQDLGYGDRVQVHTADGHGGWPPGAPYDAVVIAAATAALPPALADQVAVGGRVVLPLGPPDEIQRLTVLTKQPDGTWSAEQGRAVVFVPFEGGPTPDAPAGSDRPRSP